MSRLDSNLDIVTFLTLVFVFVVAIACVFAGCAYDYDNEATGWSPDAGPDVHRGEYLTPPAARIEHSKGKQP